MPLTSFKGISEEIIQLLLLCPSSFWKTTLLLVIIINPGMDFLNGTLIFAHLYVLITVSLSESTNDDIFKLLSKPI
jgi:hypothetical protein